MLPSKSFMTLYHLLAKGRIEDIRSLLTNHVINVNSYYTSNDLGFRGTALHFACFWNHRDIAELLLDHGADIEALTEDSYNYTPLIMACVHGRVNVVKLLLDRGANLHDTTTKGHTLLHRVCFHTFGKHDGQKECVEELLSRGADPNVKNKKGKTALDYARGGGRDDIVDVLVRYQKKEEEEQIKTSPFSDTTDRTSLLENLKTQMGECICKQVSSMEDSIRLDILSHVEQVNSKVSSLEESILAHQKYSIGRQEHHLNQIQSLLTENETKIMEHVSSVADEMKSSMCLVGDQKARSRTSSSGMKTSFENKYLDPVNEEVVQQSAITEEGQLLDKSNGKNEDPLRMISLVKRQVSLKISTLEEDLDSRIKAILDRKLEEVLVHDRILGIVERELKESITETVCSEIKSTLSDYLTSE